LATNNYRIIQTAILISGEPAPWRILKPDLGAICEARKKNKKAKLVICLDGEPKSEQTIQLSNVRIRKKETKGGPRGTLITEEWFFSGEVWITREEVWLGRCNGRLYFEGGQLTGEIRGWIPLPPKVKV